ENERLLTLRKTSFESAGSAGVRPDLLFKSGLRDMGLNTPEATVQTYFWAACEGQLKRWSECQIGGANSLQQDSDRQQKSLLEQMKDFVGFRIADKKIISADEVEMKLTMTGPVFTMKLKLIGTEWKITDFFLQR
ncbi:MAG: hypothetical protein ABIP71_09075, partial [Verrucomicrobiota bacterium]